MRPAKSFWKKVQLCRMTCQVDQVGHDGMVADQGIEGRGHRADDHHHGGHQQQGLPVLGEHFAGRGGCQHADHQADEDRHHGIGNGADGHQAHAPDIGGSELVDEIEDERPEPHRGLAVGLVQGNRRVKAIEPSSGALEHFCLMRLCASRLN
jgi:hypothetical protein